MIQAVIAGYVRTPFHFGNKGDMKRLRADDMATFAVNALVKRTGVKTADIEDLRVELGPFDCSQCRPSR